MRRSVAAATTACEVWLKHIIPEFEPLSADLLEPAPAHESALDPLDLANKVVREVSIAGVRARVEAKRTTWRDFGDVEAHTWQPSFRKLNAETFRKRSTGRTWMGSSGEPHDS